MTRIRWPRGRTAALVAGLALATAACGNGGATTAPTTSAAGEVTPTPATAASAAQTAAVDAACADPTTFAARDDDSRLGQPIGLVDNTRRPWCLGPALLSNQRTTAKVVPSATGGQAVTLTVAPGAADAWNQALRYCFTRDAAICPSGGLAVLLGGEVLTVPNVAADRLENNQLVLAGRFADGKPSAVEARFAADAITLRPVIRTVGAADQKNS